MSLFSIVRGWILSEQAHLNGQNSVKISVSHVNAHQKLTSAEKDFHDRVGRMTTSVDTQPPLSPPNGPMDKGAMGMGWGY